MLKNIYFKLQSKYYAEKHKIRKITSNGLTKKSFIQSRFTHSKTIKNLFLIFVLKDSYHFVKCD